MSVLSFPRIYFKGYMEWDPCTFNNNDWPAKFSTYDATNAALNWTTLGNFGITQSNFTTQFRPWAIRLQEDQEQGDAPPFGPRVPAEWNMFGSHKVAFVQHTGDLITTIKGGDLAYGVPTPASDPILNKTVGIKGDGGSGGGCLVDTNPTSPWSSQIYFGQFRFGDGTLMTAGQRVYRMHSRWLNANRIYSLNTVPSLTTPASSIGVCFQTCIPNNQISWATDWQSSKLLTELKSAATQPGAQGIMIRFTAYVNLYFMNGILNNELEQPRDYEALAVALEKVWDIWKTTGQTSQFFSNPCYSHIVGVIGVWNQGELASMPGGRCLNADVPVAPPGPPPTMSNAVPQTMLIAGHELKRAAVGSAGQVPLGPAAVNVDYNSSLISLDFSGVMPEGGPAGVWPSDLTKVDFGQLTLGVVTPNGQFNPISVINYNQYEKSAYEAKAGIIDIPFPNAGTGPLLGSGTIALQVQGQPQGAYALQEQTYTAETDTRGIYLDQNENGKFDVTVFKMGTPTPGTKLLVAKYDSTLSLIPSTGTQLVNITNGFQVTVPIPGTTAVSNAAIFDTNQNGVATVEIAPQNPGFPVLAFFPYPTGSTQPQPPASFNFLDDAFYTTVRVLPFDDTVPGTFCTTWNGSPDPSGASAWNFVYNNILYVYDMLFSVMLKHVNLGSQSAVDNNLCGIWNTIAKEAALESTGAMPITRDLSEGKRRTLQLYIYLAYNNFKIVPLNVNSIPPGWTPCT